MALFDDYGICLPFLGVLAIMVAAIMWYIGQHWKSGALERSSGEMKRYSRGQEDTYIIDFNHGILGKQVSVPYNQSRDYVNCDWAAIGDFSGKKYHLPSALPSFCWELPPIDLNPSCGVGKRLQIVLPYDKHTKLMFLKPYIDQIHYLTVEMTEKERMYNEIIDLLHRTKYSVDALDFIEELERRRRPKKGASTVLAQSDEQGPPQRQLKAPPQLPPQQGQGPPQQ